MGYVYLILEVNLHGEEQHKIGITKNEPNIRLSQLKTGNPNEVRLLQYYESVNYKKVEKRMHDKYANNKTLAKNEWFNLTDEQVLSFIDDCKEADKIISFLKEHNPFFK
jgi:hypothetical protein